MKSFNFQVKCSTRLYIPALPFSRIEKTVALPKPQSYPKVLKTIGDHIRAWRLDNGLLQADVARILSVCEDSVVGWETRCVIPSIHLMPCINKMLGYLPHTLDLSTLGGKLTFYRYSHGLTPKEFGALIPAHPSTILDWEKGRHLPPKGKREKIEAVINK